MVRLNITRAHALALGYWRLSPTLRAKLPAPNIHELVNDHAGVKMINRGALNALALVQLRRKNGDDARAALLPSNWDRANNVARFHAMSRWRRRLLCA